MEINDALVTAITRELLRRLQTGEIKSSDKPSGTGHGTSSAGSSHSQGSPSQGRRKVISEVELMQLCPASAGTGQSVQIGSRDIITPLAEDYIAKMRITVNRIG